MFRFCSNYLAPFILSLSSQCSVCWPYLWLAEKFVVQMRNWSLSDCYLKRYKRRRINGSNYFGILKRFIAMELKFYGKMVRAFCSEELLCFVLLTLKAFLEIFILKQRWSWKILRLWRKLCDNLWLQVMGIKLQKLLTTDDKKSFENLKWLLSRTFVDQNSSFVTSFFRSFRSCKSVMKNSEEASQEKSFKNL